MRQSGVDEVELSLFHVPLRMKGFAEPCGPQGLPAPVVVLVPSGITEIRLVTLLPWQSLQYMVWLPTAALQGVLKALVAVRLRLLAVRPVERITGCQERWLLLL